MSLEVNQMMAKVNIYCAILGLLILYQMQTNLANPAHQLPGTWGSVSFPDYNYDYEDRMSLRDYLDPTGTLICNKEEPIDPRCEKPLPTKEGEAQ